jgi:hypothetical protein
MLFLFFAHCDGLILAVLIKKKYDEKKDAAISFSLSPTWSSYAHGDKY